MNEFDPLSRISLKCSKLILVNLNQELLQKQTRPTYLENFKAIDVQHSDVQLLMIFHHGSINGLKSNGCNSLNSSFIDDQFKKRKNVPRQGSQTHARAGLWRARLGCNTPAPRSGSRRWIPWCFPIYCPSSCL